MEILGRRFSSCIRSDEYREYLVRWVRMCPFDFPTWDSFELACPETTVSKVRRLLDTIRCLVRFTCFATTENAKEPGKWFTSGTFLPPENFWSWFGKLYSRVVRENGIESSSRIAVDFDNAVVRVEGKLVSFEYVREMKKDVGHDFEALVSELREWLEFGSVGDVYTTVMGNRTISVVDDLSSQGSVFNVIPMTAVEGHIMGFRDRQDANNKGKCDRILKIINGITKLLMLAVWINPGLALRFPELSILSFSGTHRNLYFDSDDRVFLIRSRYNKNTKYDTRLLFLDEDVSAKLFWFLYILRPFTISILGNEVWKMNSSAIMGALIPQETLPDTQSVEEEAEDINFNAELYHHQMELSARLRNADSQQLGGAIFRSLVFIDVRRLVLVHRSTFVNVLLKYPKDTARRESHRIRSMRQGLCSLWRHFIEKNVLQQGATFNEEVARGFGHSYAVDQAVYGFDNARSVGPEEVPFAIAKKLCKEFQKLTTRVPAKKRPEAQTDVDESGEGRIGDAYDLMDAGNQIIPGFAFRTREQERFTNMVLTSDGGVLALQACTAFGKTMTYVLPMLVLKKTRPGKYVHFIAVPYVSLKIATIQKLKDVGLQAADMAVLISSDRKSQLRNTDVLIGTFDIFATHDTFTFINGWNEELLSEEQGIFCCGRSPRAMAGAGIPA
ncbi:hypothetical protein HG535_0D06370 [Zygotorulaspora mrakii]|uniref:DEAD/DEAH-box helicase domain-containing protein n=1 Tax=Zygotorulaspora mrakii TaxID=42260 RepID=A0A7H9B2N5_ZYGMR|nr:uncharacterized protein HG535_0D06370 [Zygotorulaspora mrakii]QLG72925.1 hypothetical protein HG535_0D06370 [Zygotorulaspora mrakii]